MQEQAANLSRVVSVFRIDDRQLQAPASVPAQRTAPRAAGSIATPVAVLATTVRPSRKASVVPTTDNTDKPIAGNPADGDWEQF
jgi:methyl-accepting chemotaxis protein